MRQKSRIAKEPAEKVVRDIRRKSRRRHSAEDRIRIVLEGLRGEDSIAALCRRAGIAESLCYSGSKEFLEAGKKRLAGDTARQATSGEVKALRAEARQDDHRADAQSEDQINQAQHSEAGAVERPPFVSQGSRKAKPCRRQCYWQALPSLV